MMIAPGPSLVLSFSAVLLLQSFPESAGGHTINCQEVLMGQFFCPEPKIDAATQQIVGCTRNNSAELICYLAKDIHCREGTGMNKTHFKRSVPCEWTNGYSFEITLILSVFLGMFGVDRLYLGYPGLALAKFCTLGGMFLWQLIDIILIAMQVVRPADDSQYVVAHFGQRLIRLVFNNETQVVAQDDW
ncbi:TM2 domain-containing protein CG10795 [Galendromus occidentalis]|uniref:TM2 domain-containing protein CG10795 n=1 Tax=Galendromus occidentalis TaxID=34638 RepID=A0AAJ6QRA4_9ACAR|nr:TM2 domain-containing protein CG10795 [Galendromus occidentalis]